MFFAAGQIRDRAKLLGHELRTAEEVALVRRELDPAVAAILLGSGDFQPLPDKLFMAPPAVVTDGFLFSRTPPPPRDLPNLSLFHQRLPMEAPSAFRSEIRDDSPNMSLVFEPNFSDVAPIEEPMLEAPITIGDEEELRVVLQAMSPEMIIILTVVSGISLFGIPMAIVAINDVRTEKRINAQREYFSSN